MGIFSSSNSYLGIDLGTSSVKVVELADFKGRPRLVTYGFTEKKIFEAGRANAEDLTADLKRAADILVEVCQKSRTSSRRVIAALPNFSVFTSVLNLPNLPKKELASAISWEAKKIIPMPLEEIILDWKIVEESAKSGNENNLPPVNAGEPASLDSSSNKSTEIKAEPSVSAVNNQATGGLKKIFSKPQKNIKVLLTGASKKLVKRYMDVFNRAGLNLLSLETENFALIRSLVGNDPSSIMIVDLGASTSSMAIVSGGMPIISRSVEIGGTAITKVISNNLNVNMDRAEQFKQDMSLDMETAENSLPQIVERSFAPILNEIKYTIGLYQEQNNKKLDKIILTGGSSMLGHLSGYLSETLNINTYLGDPWARVVYPTELKPVLDRLGSRFAVAIGLAMRDIE